MASTAASSVEIQGALAQVYADQVNNQYVSVAMACWFLWDHIVTFDQEIKLIWNPRHWNAITILFVFVRYGISIGYPISLYATFTRADVPNVCPYSDVFLFWFVILGHAIQLALGLRVWALYNRGRWTGVFLLLLFLALIGVSFDLSISYLIGGRSPIPPVAPGTPQLFGCLMNPIPGYFRTLVATTIFETVIVVMTIWKVALQLRQKHIPFVNYLLSSGVAYYVAMLAMLAVNLLTKAFPVLSVPVLSSSCILVVQGIACCHIVLGMLRQGKKSKEFATHSLPNPEESVTESTISFFSIPTGIYPKEVLDHLEYGLPPLEMDDSLEGEEFSIVPMVPLNASATLMEV